MTEFSCIWEAKAQLGESPVWDEDSGSLLWVDIKKNHLHRYRPKDGDKETIALDHLVGSIALRRGGGLVAASGDGFAFLDAATGALNPISDPEQHLAGNRFNDGKCDSAGRFIAGTMDDGEKKPSGSVYGLDRRMNVEKLFGGYVVCNGPAFAPDGETLYFSDSHNCAILAFAYDPPTGRVGASRLFAQIPESDGYPDGLTVDAEGGVWNAHWDGARVTRYWPNGKIDRVISLPVPRPTSCAFGGKDLDVLYVTSARQGLGADELDTAPLSGGLFAVKPGMAGLAPHRFQG